jgi:hypothetical protein
MKRTGLVLAALLGLVACGGDDGEGGGSPGGGSFGAISDAIAAPTGTVDMSTAPAIAEEFEAIQQGGAMGERFEQASGSQTITQACASSGEILITAMGSQTSSSSVFTYNDCCQTAGCCLNGDGTTYVTNAGGSAYNVCAEYAITASCGGEPSTVSYEGCQGAMGWTYVVRVEGESFAVSGNYSNGNGTLEIRGENGMYSCTYSNGTGSCTGDGSFAF